MNKWTIDEDGLVECDCGVTGFQVIVGPDGVVCLLECVSCGTTHDATTEEFKKAGQDAARAYERMHNPKD